MVAMRWARRACDESDSESSELLESIDAPDASDAPDALGESPGEPRSTSKSTLVKSTLTGPSSVFTMQLFILGLHLSTVTMVYFCIVNDGLSESDTGVGAVKG